MAELGGSAADDAGADGADGAGASGDGITRADDASHRRHSSAAEAAAERLANDAATTEAAEADAISGGIVAVGRVPKPVTQRTLDEHAQSLEEGAAVVAEASPRIKPRMRRLRRAMAEEATSQLLKEAEDNPEAGTPTGA